MELPIGWSTITRLRAETREPLRRVGCELELLAGQTSWLDYRLYLCRMYGFHVPVEAALGLTPRLASVIADAHLRNHKVALLSHDLVALGVERRDLAQLPRMAIPPLHDLPEALGWMYVLEGVTLDGKALSRRLASQLPVEIGSAAAYLGCYGEEVRARWLAFGVAVDRYATDAGVEDRIVTAATDCLARLHRWFRPSAYVEPIRLRA